MMRGTGLATSGEPGFFITCWKNTQCKNSGWRSGKEAKSLFSFSLSLPVALSEPGLYHCSTSTLLVAEQAHPPVVRTNRGPDRNG